MCVRVCLQLPKSVDKFIQVYREIRCPELRNRIQAHLQNYNLQSRLGINKKLAKYIFAPNSILCWEKGHNDYPDSGLLNVDRRGSNWEFTQYFNNTTIRKFEKMLFPDIAEVKRKIMVADWEKKIDSDTKLRVIKRAWIKVLGTLFSVYLLCVCRSVSGGVGLNFLFIMMCRSMNVCFSTPRGLNKPA